MSKNCSIEKYDVHIIEALKKDEDANSGVSRKKILLSGYFKKRKWFRTYCKKEPSIKSP